MLVRFKSTDTESITMFGDVALQLLRMLGHSGTIPSAIAAKDIPNAVRNLREQLQVAGVPMTDDADQEPPVALSTRAQPLIQLLKRAAAADVPVMWELA
jgi:hypothetical protein